MEITKKRFWALLAISMGFTFLLILFEERFSSFVSQPIIHSLIRGLRVLSYLLPFYLLPYFYKKDEGGRQIFQNRKKYQYNIAMIGIILFIVTCIFDYLMRF